MTSQIRSRIEYLIPTDNILVLLLHSNSIWKCRLTDRFTIRFNEDSEVAYFLLGHPVYNLVRLSWVFFKTYTCTTSDGEKRWLFWIFCEVETRRECEKCCSGAVDRLAPSRCRQIDFDEKAANITWKDVRIRGAKFYQAPAPYSRCSPIFGRQQLRKVAQYRRYVAHNCGNRVPVPRCVSRSATAEDEQQPLTPLRRELIDCNQLTNASDRLHPLRLCDETVLTAELRVWSLGSPAFVGSGTIDAASNQYAVMP